MSQTPSRRQGEQLLLLSAVLIMFICIIIKLLQLLFKCRLFSHSSWNLPDLLVGLEGGQVGKFKEFIIMDSPSPKFFLQILTLWNCIAYANCQGSACHRPSPPPSLPPTSVSIPSCTTPDSIQQVSKTTQNMLICDQQAVTWDCELIVSSSRWPWALSVAEQLLLCASTLLLDSTSQIPFSRWDGGMEVMEQHHEVEIHWLWSASSPALDNRAGLFSS